MVTTGREQTDGKTARSQVVAGSCRNTEGRDQKDLTTGMQRLETGCKRQTKEDASREASKEAKHTECRDGTVGRASNRDEQVEPDAIHLYKDAVAKECKDAGGEARDLANKAHAIVLIKDE